jgi:hypothetical protein
LGAEQHDQPATREGAVHTGHHQPPDHAAGDERTLGGYMAVHKRPPAFEGVDGFSYSVDILTDATGEAAAPWGAYLFFVRWGHGEPEVQGHLETDFVVKGASEAVVRHQLGAMPLASVKATLDGLIRTRTTP